MAGALTQQQLDDLVDVIGGLFDSKVPIMGKALPGTPAAGPAPQEPQVPKSPYAELWHKALRGRKPNQPYVPTSSLAVHPTRAPKAPVAPKPPSPHALLMNQRPQRPPAAQPFQEAQAPKVEPPRDQQSILQKVDKQARQQGGDPGTYLAHEIRERPLDPSIAVQFQAAPVESLEELTTILNDGYHAEPGEELRLDAFHDDRSPFVALSQPRQSLQQGRVPSVVVGEPYIGLTHQLETAFPGVHFFPTDQARGEIERAAAQTAKPLPNKALDDPAPTEPTAAKPPEAPKEQPSQTEVSPPPTAPEPSPAPVSPPPPQPVEPPAPVEESVEEESPTTEDMESPQQGTHPYSHLQPAQASFLHAIKDDPQDATPRLIYADWLEEYGTPSEAALGDLIRLQVKFGSSNYSYSRLSDDPRLKEIYKRQDQLMGEHPEWFEPWGEYNEMPGTMYEGELSGGAQFINGMLRVTWPAGSFLQVIEDGGGPERTLASVDTVRLYGNPTFVTNAIRASRTYNAMDPNRVEKPVMWLPYIATLDLTVNSQLYQTAYSVASVLASKQGHNLRSLYLGHTRIGRRHDNRDIAEYNTLAVKSLADSEHLNTLHTLDLSYNDLSHGSIQALIYSTSLQGIKRLDLRGNQLTTDQAKRLKQRFDDAVKMDIDRTIR